MPKQIFEYKQDGPIFSFTSETVEGETEYRECDWHECPATATFENLVGVQLCDAHFNDYYTLNY